MATVLLPIIFLTAGCLAIWYYRHTPPVEELRVRLPNRVSPAAIILTAIIGVGIWLIVRYLQTPFQKISGVTTLLFFLLTFETALLLFFRRLRSNAAAVVAAAVATLIPFAIQFRWPSFEMSNAIIVAATLGATTLMIRLGLLRTRIIVLMTVLLTFNDVINVWYVLPQLPLAPYPQIPYPLLIFPTVNIAGRVVGSGDFMFLALATLVILRDLNIRTALVHVGAQTLALFVTLALTARTDVLIPYLTVMAPIFILTYIIGRRTTARRTNPAAPAESEPSA